MCSCFSHWAVVGGVAKETPLKTRASGTGAAPDKAAGATLATADPLAASAIVTSSVDPANRLTMRLCTVPRKG